MEKINNIMAEFKKYSVIGYKWDKKKINSFNNTLNKINSNINIFEDNHLKSILKNLTFILNDLKNIKNKFEPEDIKINAIKLSAFLFDNFVGNTVIEPRGISLILNAFDNFGYNRNDLQDNTLNINILINAIQTIVFTRGNSQNISNTLVALYNFGFRINELVDNGFDLELLFKAINNNLLTKTVSLNIINILDILYYFKFSFKEMEQYGLDIKLLFNKINEHILINNNTREILTILNILSKFQYTRTKLINSGFDINLLFEIINTNIPKLNNINYISKLILNLSKCGYTMKTLMNDNMNINLLFHTINSKVLQCGNLENIKNILDALYSFEYTTDTMIKNRLNTILLFFTTNNEVLLHNNSKEIEEIINVLFDFGYSDKLVDNNFDNIKKELFEIIINDISIYKKLSPTMVNSMSYLSNYKNVIYKNLRTHNLNIDLLFDSIIKNISLSNNIDSIYDILKSLYQIINVKNTEIRENMEYIINITNLIWKKEELNNTKEVICSSLKNLKNHLKLAMTNQLETKLTSYRINDINMQSVFEYGFKRFIRNNIKDNSKIVIVQDMLIKEKINGIFYVHRPNFMIINNNKKYIIELNETNHFSKEDLDKKDSLTLKKDFLLKKYCNKNDITFITISSDKFDLFVNKEFENFNHFLNKEIFIDKTEEKKVNIKLFNLEAKSFNRNRNINNENTNNELISTSNQLNNGLNAIDKQFALSKKCSK